MSLVVTIVIIGCIVLGAKTVQLKKQSLDLSEKQTSLEKQKESEEERRKELEDLEKYMNTKKFMEEVAKDKLGLVYPDEILIQPSD